MNPLIILIASIAAFLLANIIIIGVIVGGFWLYLFVVLVIAKGIATEAKKQIVTRKGLNENRNFES